MSTYNYIISADTLNGNVDSDKLASTIELSAIVPNLTTIDTDSDSLTINFDSALSVAEESSLTGIVNSHDGIPIPETSNPQQVIVGSEPPFAAKELSNGKKLFKRVHGVKVTLSGDTIVSIVVPYNECKIDKIQMVWCPKGLTADFKVYDTPTGTITSTLAATNYTAIPNFMLNQFGFDVGVAEGSFEEVSKYDADLIKDMKLEVTLKNPNNLTDEVCVNFVLHELK